MLTGVRRFAPLVALISVVTPALVGQQNRVSSRIDKTQMVVLRGHINPKARAEYDLGSVESGFQMPAVILHLKGSATQQSSLSQLLAGQQDPSSQSFHKWLTPEQYADSFGVSQNDIDKITAWLQSQGFTVQEVSRSRTWLAFSGTAEQTQNAFQTEIHRYNVGGEVHYANATEPSIPAALADVVAGFHGLNNFHLKPRLIKEKLSPEMTLAGGTHHIAPDDLAAIYDIAPLYQAGVNGSGQKIAVLGQTDIKLTDIQAFRTKFNLPAANVQQVAVPNHPDPGIVSGDIDEADLDIEWSGAVARNATIVYVYSDDVVASLYYAVDQNLAPVITMSYGSCEAGDLIDLPIMQSAARQANAQGITWLAASGDAGAGDCEDASAAVAQNGPAVDAPSSIPEVTSLGGSELSDQSGTYWNTANTANGASALGYIPEKVWNDTALDGSLSAGGGGASIYFAKPSWQTGPGVPNDNFRHVPDLSLSASADHDGYYVYTGGSANYYGGTSVAAPSMAGIVALLNQYLVSTGAQSQPGVGNINPALYRLAQNKPGVFHDITQGDNKVPCSAGSPGCSNGVFGFSAGPGYDLATGLGSPDAYNLVHQWSSQPPLNSAVVPAIDQNPVFQKLPPDRSGRSWAFTITLTEEAGIATTLTGFTMDGTTYDPMASFGTVSIPANGSIVSKGLGFATLAAPKTVVFGFTGVDATGQQWSQQLSVPFNGPQIRLGVAGVTNAASGQQVFAPGMIVSVYGSQMGNFAQSAATLPLPNYLAGFSASVNGVQTPLYYVSPNQVNLQIPYETPVGATTLTIGNPYQNVDYQIQIAQAAPGIFLSNGFVSAPFSSARRGQASTLYITGEGAVKPTLATGASPAPGTAVSRLPKPVLPVTVTVAGEQATVSFAGIPSGLAGVSQVNFQIPADAPLGVQNVVVTVGTVASQPAKITITQ